MRAFLIVLSFMFLVLGSWAQPCSAKSRPLPLAFALPGGCNIVQVRTNLFGRTWGCDFSSIDGRSRSIFITMHEFSFELVSKMTLSSLSETQLHSELRSILNSAQRSRKAAAPSGYRRLERNFFKFGNWVQGFNTCVRTRDVFPAKQTGKKRDRVDLHCVAIERKSGALYQLLFTYQEINTASVSVSPRFEEDAQRVVESVRPTVP